MMDMQEVKARKPHSVAAQTLQDHDTHDSQEVDPSVQTAPLLHGNDSEQHERRRHGKHVKSWVQFVLDRVWSAAFLAVASFGLHEAQFVHEVLYAPEANRVYVHAGIGSATLVVFIGCYIELYRSLLLGERVSYATAKTSTHAMLCAMVATGVWYEQRIDCLAVPIAS